MLLGNLPESFHAVCMMILAGRLYFIRGSKDLGQHLVFVCFTGLRAWPMYTAHCKLCPGPRKCRSRSKRARIGQVALGCYERAPVVTATITTASLACRLPDRTRSRALAYLAVCECCCLQGFVGWTVKRSITPAHLRQNPAKGGTGKAGCFLKVLTPNLHINST